MKSKWNIPLVIITAIISYLYQAVSSDKLPFLETILSAEVLKFIKHYSFGIILLLIILYVICYIIVFLREHDYNKKVVCENICKSVFELIEKNEGHDYMQHVRVSIFKVNNLVSSNQCLKYYSRYQTRTPIKKSSIKYTPGKGCVGLCFETQTNISISIPEYEKSSKKYTEETKKRFHLSEEEIDKLNIKSSTFIGIPICCYNSGHTWGVLIVDSTKNTTNLEPLTREIEKIVNTCKVFFLEG